MKDKNMLYIIGAIILIALFMFSGTKKEAGEFVQFRTTSTIYGSGGAIAIANTCGDSLTAYGHKSQSTYNCKTSEIILHTNEGYPVCKRVDYPNRIYIQKTSSGAYYEIGDSDASKVDTSLTSINPDLEVLCTQEPTCEDTSWTPSTSTVCSGDSFEQVSNCGNTKQAIGTKDCSAPCEDTTWSPSTSNYCEGNTFTQVSNCGTTRTSTGTKDCSCPTCPTCDVCDEACTAVGDSNCDGCMSDLEFLQAVNAWKTQEGC